MSTQSAKQTTYSKQTEAPTYSISQILKFAVLSMEM